MTFRPVFINFEAQQESAWTQLQENKQKGEGYSLGAVITSGPFLAELSHLSDQEDSVCHLPGVADLGSTSSVNRWEKKSCENEETSRTKETNYELLSRKLHIQLKDNLTALGKVFGETEYRSQK